MQQNFPTQSILLKEKSMRSASLNPALGSQMRPLSRGVRLDFPDRQMKAPSDWLADQALNQGFHTFTPQGFFHNFKRFSKITESIIAD